jgi:hypothetical protein
MPLLNPSDWAFEFITVGEVTFVSFTTAVLPSRFPESEERRFLMANLGEASELVECVFEVRSSTIGYELSNRGFVHGSSTAGDLLRCLGSMGYFIPPVDDDN